MIRQGKKAVILLLLGILCGLPFPCGLSGAPVAGIEPPAPSRTPDPGLAVSVESLLRKGKDRGERVLIDVRKKDRFEAFRIPGAVNIPLFAVRTKGFLKSRPLILANEGFEYRQIEKECQRLRRAGFKAWVLRGGLYQWREKGGVLAGDVFAQKAMSRVPPGSFAFEMDYGKWLNIDVSSPPGPVEAGPVVAGAVSVPFHDEAAFINPFERAVAGQGKDPFLTLLVFNKDGEGYDKVERAIRRSGFKTPFFLEGGEVAYRDFLEKQARLMQRAQRSSETGKPCPTCPR